MNIECDLLNSVDENNINVVNNIIWMPLKDNFLLKKTLEDIFKYHINMFLIINCNNNETSIATENSFNNKNINCDFIINKCYLNTTENTYVLNIINNII